MAVRGNAEDLVTITHEIGPQVIPGRFRQSVAIADDSDTIEAW